MKGWKCREKRVKQLKFPVTLMFRVLLIYSGIGCRTNDDSWYTNIARELADLKPEHNFVTTHRGLKKVLVVTFWHCCPGI